MTERKDQCGTERRSGPAELFQRQAIGQVEKIAGLRVFRRHDLGRSAVLDELIESVGETVALKLVETFGGARVYIPHNPDATSPLAIEIGPEAAMKLARVYGGERVELPKPTARRARILELRTAGVSVDTIARQLGCTRRRVFQVLAEARATPATGSESSARRIPEVIWQSGVRK